MKKIMFNNRFGLTKAVLSRWKTNTRRIIKSRNIIARHWNPAFNAGHCYYTDERGRCQLIDSDTDKIIVPKFKVGEVVAVAQSYRSITEEEEEINGVLGLYRIGQKYLTMDEMGAGWSNKMFTHADLMPHHIRITGIKAERLQGISDEDCIKEGIVCKWHAPACRNYYYIPNEIINHPNKVYETPQEAYATLIDRISGKGTWASNPWVFVYDFELVD